jgi:hypothetical protein
LSAAGPAPETKEQKMNEQTALRHTVEFSEIAGEIRRRLRREKAKLFVSQAIVFLLAVAFIFMI